MRGLEGIKVVELTSYVAAPACPRILGEMGATVYKVEPESGDEYRTNGPGFGMKKTVRKTFVPCISFVSAIASANAMMLMIRRDAIANSTVYQNE